MRIPCLTLALAALALLSVSGCTLQLKGYSGDCTVITVINNTSDVDLEILAENRVICEKLEPGKHYGVPIRFNRYTNISVIGRDSYGGMVGGTAEQFYGGEYREYNYNYPGYSGGSGALSQSWIINTENLRRRE